MSYLGNVDFVEGRAASKTTALMLEGCLDEGESVNEFLETMKIKPDAFFKDIDGDWNGRPFIGEHVFKVVQAAGYEGTEHDLWNTVTGDPAPYPVKLPKVARPKKPKESATMKAECVARKAARHTAIKAAWVARG